MVREVDCNSIQALVKLYISKGGEMIELEEGVLGWGLTVLYSFELPLKTIIIKEECVNGWSSRHTVRCYKKMPKKYEIMIEKKLNEKGEWE